MLVMIWFVMAIRFPSRFAHLVNQIYVRAISDLASVRHPGLVGPVRLLTLTIATVVRNLARSFVFMGVSPNSASLHETDTPLFRRRLWEAKRRGGWVRGHEYDYLLTNE